MTSLNIDDIIIKLNDSVTNIDTGVSPSGKATDSDSVTSGVRIPAPQPYWCNKIDALLEKPEISGFFYALRTKFLR